MERDPSDAYVVCWLEVLRTAGVIGVVFEVVGDNDEVALAVVVVVELPEVSEVRTRRTRAACRLIWLWSASMICLKVNPSSGLVACDFAFESHSDMRVEVEV